MAQEDPKKKSLDDMLQSAAIEKFGLKPVMDKIEKVMPLLEQVAAGVDVLKGADGKTPELGKDYLTEEQQRAALDMVRPVKGRDYTDGAPGQDGYTPQRGIDYLSDDEVASIKEELRPKKGADYFTPEEVDQFKTSVTPKKGIDYNDGENPTPAQFLEVVKGLKGKEAADFSQVVGAKIDISHVRNAGSFIFNGKKYDTSELMHGGGSGSGGGVTSLNTLTGDVVLAAGSNITLTPAGNTITIAATGGGSSITLQTDGVDNGDQTLLNLEAGTNITLTDNGTGTVTIDATAGGGTVDTVVGTANRITVDSTDPANPVIDIAATYVGQTSITTLGTVSTGTWSATAITLAKGGTGADLSGIAKGGLIVGTAATTVAVKTVGSDGQVLTADSASTGGVKWATPTTGTVTAVSVASANGFAGSSGGGATPILTLTTTVNSPVLAGNGTSISAATTTGSGSTVVLAGSPTITTASLGSSTATTQTPSDNSTKIATTAYVDAAVLGQNFKEATLVATTANLVGVYLSNVFTYTATGTNTIDGVTLALGNRVLVKNQTTTFQNGWYVVTTAGAIGVAGVLTRSTDANTSGEFKTGDSSFVTSGTANSNTTWAYTGVDSPTLGTDAITYAQTAGQGSFTQGAGITITGNSIALTTPVTVALGGTNATSASITSFNNITGYTAAGATGTTSTNLVFSTSPTLVTPTLGAASATSINKMAITAPATSSTLAVADGKTFTVSNTLTFTGTDTNSFAFPSGSDTVVVLGATQTLTSKTLTSPTIQTSPVLAAATNLKFTVPSSDPSATGITTNEFNSGYSSTAIGDLVYLDSSATWQKADADASAATYSGLLGIALAVVASGSPVNVLLQGFVYAGTAFPTFTIGSPVYMSATAGAVTQTAPVTTDSATRVLGFAVHADKMWFNPSNDYITHT